RFVNIAVGWTCKERSAKRAEPAGRDLGNRTSIVSPACRRVERVGCLKIESVQRAIKSLSRRKVPLVTESQIQREMAIRAKVILHKQSEITRLVCPESINIKSSGSRQAEKESRQILSQRRCSRIVERTSGPVRPEQVIAAGKAVVDQALADHAQVGARFQTVLAGDFGQRGEDLKNIERIVGAPARAHPGKAIESDSRKDPFIRRIRQ